MALATGELRKRAAPDAECSRPELFIVPGKQPEIIDAAEQVLVANAARLRVFQRAGEVVRVVALERESESGGFGARLEMSTLHLSQRSTCKKSSIG